MTDNIVTSKSTSGEEAKPAKKTPAKKAAAKPKAEVENTEDVVEAKPAKASKKSNQINLIIFETGASYSSGGLVFTREDRIQEVSDEDYAFLLTLENFRRADPHEIEEYLASKED
jgi:hypothetical protein